MTRENEILDALLEGESNKEISKTVFMSIENLQNPFNQYLIRKSGLKIARSWRVGRWFFDDLFFKVAF